MSFAEAGFGKKSRLKALLEHFSVIEDPRAVAGGASPADLLRHVHQFGHELAGAGTANGGNSTLKAVTSAKRPVKLNDLAAAQGSIERLDPLPRDLEHQSRCRVPYEAPALRGTGPRERPTRKALEERLPDGVQHGR